MGRRLIAVVGSLALMLTILPAMPDNTSGALDCCNGIMCPMHATETHEKCGTDKSAALGPCPVQAGTHYTATIVFVLLAPAVLYHELRSEPAIAFLPNLYSDAERRVDSPPPRLLVTA